MFFILSKLLLNFILPATWLVLTVLGALLFKRQDYRKACMLAAGILFLIFTNPFLLNQFASYWDVEQTASNRRYSCAIVLGGFVSEGQDAEGYFNGSADRFIQALKLKHSGKADNLLFTGGNADLRPSGFREANWLSRELKFYQIPDSAVLIENRSRNTLENIKFSKKLLDDRGLAPPYLLVTSAFHMRRALLTCSKAGIQVEPHTSNFIAGRERVSADSFLPSLYTLLTWNKYIKEVVGYWVYYIKN